MPSANYTFFIAPDKFKGSLTCFEVCAIIKKSFADSFPSALIKIFPMADGGDGFTEVMKYYLKAKTVKCVTVNPFMKPIHASWLWQKQNKTAVIEIASASGLALLKNKELNPMQASTYGTGLLIKNAVKKGAKKIILGLGGSATNDGGLGILAALGFKLLDEKGKNVPYNGSGLLKIKNIIPPAPIHDVEFVFACDVKNTLYGLKGAAHIFAPQKGADKKMVHQLDEGLKNFAHILKKISGNNISNIAGTGAAGGVAAGLMSFFKSTIVSGFQLICNESKLQLAIENELKQNKNQKIFLITAEGKLDHQSINGKVVGEIAKLGKQYQIPTIVFCGQLALTANQCQKTGIVYATSILNSVTTIEQSIKQATPLLSNKAYMLAQLMCANG